MKEIYDTLWKYAAAAKVQITSFDTTKLILSISIPSRGNEVWKISIPELIHFDMNPEFTLGRIEFGDISLLPIDYINERNLDYGGDSKNYRVIKFTDIDEKNHYIISYEHEILNRI